MLHRRLPIIRHFHARPRLALAMSAGVLLFYWLPENWRQVTRILVAWDAATGLYLLLATVMMVRSKVENIRRRACQEDEGRFRILALTTATALASLAAIAMELASAKASDMQAQWPHMALAGVTVFLSWSFLHTIFALHYAHEYYMDSHGAPAKGLEFPGDDRTPDYWDFVYHAFVIGTSTATADVGITSRIMRRTAAWHCVAAFFFNTTILALTVNIAAGLF